MFVIAMLNIDLKLLTTMEVLLREKSVTRTAKRLGLSQPSVSVQLRRLREAFGDPLLVQGTLTVRAEALLEPLHVALQGMNSLVQPVTFDPLSAEKTWRIAAADYGALAVLAPAMKRLRKLAPRSRIAVLQLQPSRITQQAERGELDLALHTIDDAPPGFRSRILFDEHYVLVGRKAHPRLERKPTLEQFRALEHIVVSPDGGGFVGATDRALGRRTRHVALSVPQFTVAIEVIKQSDLVAMLPSRLVQGRNDVHIVEAPVKVPGYSFAMLWHERVHEDPSHRWLREQLIVDQQYVRRTR